MAQTGFHQSLVQVGAVRIPNLLAAHESPENRKHAIREEKPEAYRDEKNGLTSKCRLHLKGQCRQQKTERSRTYVTHKYFGGMPVVD